MNPFALPIPYPANARFSVQVVSNTCGITVVTEGRHRLLWITLAGKLQLHDCDSAQELMDLLQHEKITTLIKNEWTKNPDPDTTFEEIYARLLNAVHAHLLQFPDSHPQETPIVTPRLRKQLLWAFDDDGTLDPEIFLTILIYENVWLSNLHLMQLVNELTQTHAANQSR